MTPLGSPLDTAAQLVDARLAGASLHSPMDAVDGLDTASAYAIQDAVTTARESAGERRIGWKVGLTALSARDAAGHPEPIYGPLFEAGRVSTGGRCPRTAVSGLAVEAEVAVRLGRAVRAGAKADEVARCVEAVHVALEIVGSRIEGGPRGILDVIADGANAVWFSIGDRLPVGTDLAGLELELRVGADATGRAATSDAYGGPAETIAWLASALASRGRTLGAGEIVLCGSVPSPHHVIPPTTARATVDDGALAAEVSFA